MSSSEGVPPGMGLESALEVSGFMRQVVCELLVTKLTSYILNPDFVFFLMYFFKVVVEHITKFTTFAVLKCTSQQH